MRFPNQWTFMAIGEPLRTILNTSQCLQSLETWGMPFIFSLILRKMCRFLLKTRSLSWAEQIGYLADNYADNNKCCWLAHWLADCYKSMGRLFGLKPLWSGLYWTCILHLLFIVIITYVDKGWVMFNLLREGFNNPSHGNFLLMGYPPSAPDYLRPSPVWYAKF